MPEVIFNGPEGRLEGRYHHTSKPGSPAAVILHPHPLYGGTMNNKIVYKMFQVFAQNNFSVLRFNFRGAGRSVGKFDDGVGELSDAATALDWIQQNNPDASHFWIGGFSFGAWIAMQLLMRRPEIEGFIAVSPPANMYDFSFLSPCPASGIILQGEKDDIVKHEDVAKLADKLTSQKLCNVEYKSFEDADHYFRNNLDDLEQELDRYVKEKTAYIIEQRFIKPDRKRRQLPRE